MHSVLFMEHGKDQTPQNAASDQDLHCFAKSMFYFNFKKIIPLNNP